MKRQLKSLLFKIDEKQGHLITKKNKWRGIYLLYTTCRNTNRLLYIEIDKRVFYWIVSSSAVGATGIDSDSDSDSDTNLYFDIQAYESFSDLLTKYQPFFSNKT